LSVDGSNQDLEPESDGGGEEVLKGLFAEVRSGWRDLKRLLRKVMKLGDIAGEVVVDAARLARNMARTAARHSGLVALCIAGVGVSSPITGGWGQNPVASSSWEGWGRSAALVLLALGLHRALRWTIQRDHEASDGKGDGASVKAKAEMARPESPALVLETYDETYCRLGGRGQPELVIGQRRWTRRSGFELSVAPDLAGRPTKGPSSEPPV
jgi:hypothetical protein